MFELTLLLGAHGLASTSALFLYTTASSSRQGATLFIDFRAVLLLACRVFHYNSQNPHPFSRFPGFAALVCSSPLDPPSPCSTRTFVNENSCGKIPVGELTALGTRGTQQIATKTHANTKRESTKNPRKNLARNHSFFLRRILSMPVMLLPCHGRLTERETDIKHTRETLLRTARSSPRRLLRSTLGKRTMQTK